MKDREANLKQELEERGQESQVVRERLAGLQEKYNTLRLENLRLDQKVSRRFSTRARGVMMGAQTHNKRQAAVG